MSVSPVEMEWEVRRPEGSLTVATAPAPTAETVILTLAGTAVVKVSLALALVARVWLMLTALTQSPSQPDHAWDDLL